MSSWQPKKIYSILTSSVKALPECPGSLFEFLKIEKVKYARSEMLISWLLALDPIQQPAAALRTFSHCTTRVRENK